MAKKVVHGIFSSWSGNLEAASTLARPAVASLIDEAIARNRVPFANAGRGPVVIRSAAAKPRR